MSNKRDKCLSDVGLLLQFRQVQLGEQDMHVCGHTNCRCMECGDSAFAKGHDWCVMRMLYIAVAVGGNVWEFLHVQG